MKRPFAFIGVICLIASALMVNSGLFAVSAVCAAALAVFLLSVCAVSLKSKHIWIIFTSFAVAAVSVSLLFIMKDMSAVSVYENKTVEFSGTVTKSEYYGTYEKLEIEVDSVNGKNENFCVTAYNRDGTGLREGEKITAVAEFKSNGTGKQSKNVKSLLADKLYFTVYNAENVRVKGESRYYKAIGAVKRYFKTVVQSYLPNETGAVAVGMTIGDRSGIGTYLRNCFNYSGTAHLLVVSGLHLTLWTVFLSKFIPILRKRKILNTAVTAVFILFYLALTGFSVSVVRAGIMIFIINLSKILNRDSDSLNSLGVAVTVLLIQNPFSVYSPSLLLSVGSTLGLILFAGKIHTFIYKSKAGKLVTKRFLGRLIADSFAVSVSVSVFTLPVFILFFDMFPVFSFVSNIFIIDLSSLLMILTVSGVFVRFLGIAPLAKCIFYFAGIISRAVIFIAEKIGMMRYSTVAVSSWRFKVFLIFAIAVSAAILLPKKFRVVKNSILPAVLTAGFIFTVAVNENFEFAHPSVDVSISDGAVCALVRDGYDSVFIGTESRNADYEAGNMLKRHNLKTIGCILIPESGSDAFAEIKSVTEDYPAMSFAFCGEKTAIPNGGVCKERVKSVALGGVISVAAPSSKTLIITNGREDIYISSDKSLQNILDFDRKYDIIILSADSFAVNGENAKKYLKDENSQIIALGDEQITVYPDTRKIYFSESF